MITIKRYIADDGKEFDNEYECEKYEHSLKIKKCSLKFYNKETILLSQENIENCLEDCYYLSIPDLDSLELVKRISDYYGYCVPDSCGNWFYDDATNDWICIDEEYINKVKKIVSLFGGE